MFSRSLVFGRSAALRLRVQSQQIPRAARRFSSEAQRDSAVASSAPKDALEELMADFRARAKFIAEPNMAGLNPSKHHLFDKSLPSLTDASEEQVEALRRVANLRTADEKQLFQARFKVIMEKWGKHSDDVGSTAVSIAVLSDKIQRMDLHCQRNVKDKETKRAMHTMIQTRRRLLKYCKRTEFDVYKRLLIDLGINEREISEWGHVRGRRPTYKAPSVSDLSVREPIVRDVPTFNEETKEKHRLRAEEIARERDAQQTSQQ